MALGVFSQVRLLLWKNWILKKRAWGSTLLELLIPMCAVAVLLIIRYVVKVETVEANLNLEFETPVAISAVATLQNLVCGTDSIGGTFAPRAMVGITSSVAGGAVFTQQLKDLFIGTMFFAWELMQNSAVGKLFPGQPVLPPNTTFWCQDTIDFNMTDYLLNHMVRIFDDVEEMEKYINSEDYGNDNDHRGIMFGVEFFSIAPAWKYAIRTNWSTLDNTATPINNLAVDFSYKSWAKYMTSGVATFQYLVDQVILISSGASLSLKTSAIPFPVPNHRVDLFSTYVGSVFGLLFLFAYLWPFSRLVRNMVEEKEQRIREGLKMMSLQSLSFWISWLITYAIMFFVIVVIFIILTKQSIFPHTDVLILFLVFYIFALNLLFFACLCSAFFSAAKTAGTISPFLLLAAFLPYFSVSDPVKNAASKYGCSLLSPVAFSLISQNLVEYESSFQGINWGNITEIHNNISVWSLITMMLFDTLMYIFLAWYFDKVWPSEFGTPESPFFLCSFNYWCGKSIVVPTAVGMNEVIEEENIYIQQAPSMKEDLGIYIRNLNKEFESDTGVFTAVKSLNLQMNESEIFCLLGHNGAGKTTTINMLNGLLPPTTGSASIYGRDLASQMNEIRSIMGICPQHDVLFNTLTVKEHLELFGTLKGVLIENLENEVDIAIQEVQLSDKANSQACTLSGGQKRRLSLAIAFIGGSKVVFLDEPTSGVDPFSRRAIWELLIQKKQGRTVILTTHFMDEADQLGDRIGILHHGELKCCGSSLFLKSKFGVGYTLTFSRSALASSDTALALEAFITNSIPETRLLSNVGSELSFRIPLTASSIFPKLLPELDSQNSKFSFHNYGLSVTTLEEIFMRVAAMASHESIQSLSAKEVVHVRKPTIDEIIARRDSLDCTTPPHLTPLLKKEVELDFSLLDASEGSFFYRQLVALLRKRWQSMLRDVKALVFQVILPLFLLTLGMGLLRIPINTTFTSLSLSPEVYNSPLPVPFNNYIYSSNSLGNISVELPTVHAVENLFTNPRDPIFKTDFSIIEEPLGFNASTLVSFSEELLESRDFRWQSRYGALFFEHSYSAANITLKAIFTNISATYGIPTFLNLGHNIVARAALNGTSITTEIHPFSWTVREKLFVQNINGIFASIVIGIAYSFIPASYCVFVVKEREFKSKHLQIISGVNSLAYWTSNFIFDFACFLAPAALGLLVIYLFGNPNFTGENLPTIAINFILYGASVIPFTYCFSFLFSSHSTAQNAMIMIYLVTGVFLMIISFALYTIPSTKEINQKYLSYLFRLFPNFCLSDTVFSLSVREIVGDWQWDLEISGYSLIFMTWEAVFYFVLTLFLEKFSTSQSLLSMFKKDPDLPDVMNLGDDEDVRAEREKIQAGKSKDDLIRIEGLRKTYDTPPKVAVKDLWFSIPKNECFGFLGVNGAGKTTALKILCGDEIASSGSAYLGGINVEDPKVRQLMGYCPQFDALHDLLTGTEHLKFYGRIRGVPEASLEKMSRSLLEGLTLTEFADRPAGTYSGGNKRKLSVAIALIGNPPVVFLDEPSTGVDPVSRRAMWNFISKSMKTRAVILTTHNMEEAEALCQRIGILVLGQLMCIGSSQHLKHRFGKGLQLDICIQEGVSTNEILKFVEDSFCGKVIELYNNRIKFNIPANENSKLVHVFSSIEENKAKFCITDYSVGQASLEQIFVSFAKHGDHEMALSMERAKSTALLHTEIEGGSSSMNVNRDYVALPDESV